ncbi:hypothetical protein P4O66_013502 [Electrophorus voltai]|uniref:Uncharacterized protein n=1 Tax=Electrophorus voltai TaxID=2609070 RepID=A0AAD8Z215_9TELE|nr:hypothetical protein P4O66_013502 [Electrophorus voltai]
MDRMADLGKSRGGGVCVMVNNSWYNNANVVTLARSCSPNLELLTLVIVNTAYIPPQANTDTALLKWEAPVHQEVTRWTAVAVLQDALDDVDWDMFWRSTDDVSEFIEAVVGFIVKLVDDTIARATIKKFPNQKSWMDKTIREALNSLTAAYNVGIISGNMDEYKSTSYGVRRAVREVKQRYRRKLESQF